MQAPAACVGLGHTLQPQVTVSLVHGASHLACERLFYTAAEPCFHSIKRHIDTYMPISQTRDCDKHGQISGFSKSKDYQSICSAGHTLVPVPASLH